jgi:hypothetical protein
VRSSKSKRGRSRAKTVVVDFGPFIVVFVLLIALPVSFLMAGAVIAAVLSHALKTNAEATHEGSELIDLNR